MSYYEILHETLQNKYFNELYIWVHKENEEWDYANAIASWDQTGNIHIHPEHAISNNINKFKIKHSNIEECKIFNNDSIEKIALFIDYYFLIEFLCMENHRQNKNCKCTRNKCKRSNAYTNKPCVPDKMATEMISSYLSFRYVKKIFEINHNKPTSVGYWLGERK